MTIKGLMKKVRRINEEHNWTSKVPMNNPAIFCEKLFLVVSELSEALEEFRNGKGLTEVYFETAHGSLPYSRSYQSDVLPKPEGIPIELADVVIRVLDFCEANEIDLEEALRLKMAYNETRPLRHGGKRC